MMTLEEIETAREQPTPDGCCRVCKKDPGFHCRDHFTTEIQGLRARVARIERDRDDWEKNFNDTLFKIQKVLGLDVADDIVEGARRARTRADTAEREIEAAWGALKVNPRDAADDPDTTRLCDSIRISLDFEIARKEMAVEAFEAEHRKRQEAETKLSRDPTRTALVRRRRRRGGRRAGRPPRQALGDQVPTRHRGGASGARVDSASAVSKSQADRRLPLGRRKRHPLQQHPARSRRNLAATATGRRPDPSLQRYRQPVRHEHRARGRDVSVPALPDVAGASETNQLSRAGGRGRRWRRKRGPHLDLQCGFRGSRRCANIVAARVVIGGLFDRLSS